MNNIVVKEEYPGRIQVILREEGKKVGWIHKESKKEELTVKDYRKDNEKKRLY